MFLYNKNPRELLAKTASKIYSKKPNNLIAVTGTNGKSSIVNFFYQIMKLNKKPVSSIGTLGIVTNKKNIQTNNNNKKESLLKINPINKQEKNSVSSAIASTPDKNSTSIDRIITLKFIDSTWIQLRDKKDNIIFSKLMNQNDEYSYNLSKNFNLTAGNAGNIIVSIDGVVKGKVGKLGEVVESLIIDNNFNK